ncbi:hypothetical protein EDC14_1004181 [Hydrogenispora ethanolica]|uniref:Uncharacterized protein n=1 Tax=Hydrogenispora ethanolica TaxID=1082276 RepID=A0A4R1S4M5_HYDET|nr:hypothetical protein [Hydrogenispora ethanolica]TCL74243.1 hypothetical protein EDC14_1004181 [Hydrogenispora ethanolica]
MSSQLINTPSSDNLLLGAGELFFNRFDSAGNPTYERSLGDASVVNLSTEVETVEHYSSMSADKGLYASANKSTKPTLKITLHEADPLNLALGLLGETAIVTQAAATGKTAQIAKAVKGGWFPLGYRRVKNVVVKEAVGTDPESYVLDVDYSVDPATGRIQILPDGGIEDDTALTVTFDLEAYQAIKVSGGKAPKIRGYLRFVGDPTQGPAYDAEFWRVTISPDGEIGLISEDFASFGLTVNIENDRKNHPDDPYYYLIKKN